MEERRAKHAWLHSLVRRAYLSGAHRAGHQAAGCGTIWPQPLTLPAHIKRTCQVQAATLLKDDLQKVTSQACSSYRQVQPSEPKACQAAYLFHCKVLLICCGTHRCSPVGHSCRPQLPPTDSQAEGAKLQLVREGDAFMTVELSMNLFPIVAANMLIFLAHVTTRPSTAGFTKVQLVFAPGWAVPEPAFRQSRCDHGCSDRPLSLRGAQHACTYCAACAEPRSGSNSREQGFSD